MATARRQLGYVSSLTTQLVGGAATLDVEFLLVGGGGAGGARPALRRWRWLAASSQARASLAKTLTRSKSVQVAQVVKAEVCRKQARTARLVHLSVLLTAAVVQVGQVAVRRKRTTAVQVAAVAQLRRRYRRIR
jgi:hypothetical protein